MAISSVSKIYDAPDPVLETDLELLAKVNTFQQTKFDEGQQQLQNEINNWAMLADVAKPQDREYINSKVNKLVAGINNLGGVDLSNPNNVNSLRSLGYNLYADNAIVNAVATTKKMRNFVSDAQGKLNGKNAKDYDPTYYEYNLNKWNEWLGDGQVGSSFDGPVELGIGSFENYQKKIQDAVSKLTPDLNEAPAPGDPNAINYLQIGNKFIKKDRIKTLIDSLTTAQDADIVGAHAWKNMYGLGDDQLLRLQTDSYTAQTKDLQTQYNSIKHQMALTQDFQQREMYASQLKQLESAIKSVNEQKKSLFDETNGKSLNEAQRQGLRSNLYFNAFKDDFATAYEFEQNKTELKMNAGRAFQLKEARAAYEFGQMMQYRKAEFDLEKEKFAWDKDKTYLEYGLLSSIGDISIQNSLGLMGPSAGAPLQLIENLGKDDAVRFTEKTVSNANMIYTATAGNFYKDAYNSMGNLPEYQQYVVKNAEGLFVPKDEASKKILDQAVLTKINQFDEISKLPVEERQKYEKNFSESDVQMMKNYQQLQEATLYKNQVKSLEDQAFQSQGLETPSEKKVYGYVWNPQTNKYEFGKEYTARQLKEMKELNTPEYQQLIQNKTWFTTNLNRNNPTYAAQSFVETPQQLDNVLTNFYEKAEKGWEKVSQNYSPFGRNVTLPKAKGGGVNPTLAQYFGDKVRRASEAAGDKVGASVVEADVDLNRVWVKYDAEAKDGQSKLRYMAEVKYKKGSTKEGDKLYKVDLTDDVIRDPGSYVARLYPRDNAQLIYGFMIDKNGSTPFSAEDGYASALKTTANPKYTFNYRIGAVKNPNGGLESFTVDVLIPKRDPETKVMSYLPVRVKNAFAGFSTSFPANYQSVVDYMNEYFKNDQSVKQFYQMHDIPTSK